VGKAYGESRDIVKRCDTISRGIGPSQIPGTSSVILDGKEAFGWRQGMARWARVVVPGRPQHVTQPGSRRQPTFFCQEDDATDGELMAQWCEQRGVEVWAYCLLPNQVHWIAVPRAWRRTVSGAAGTRARPPFASAETRSEEGIKTIVPYDVP
jgi:hypothetical protein